jgi:serine/threonine protein kinase
MTKEQMTKQLEDMEEITVGTTGNRILHCPSHYTYGIPCRGVLKVYRHTSVYQHVKRCLTLLETVGIGARILYADDATATMVEEDMGRVTMMNAPIPLDYDVQLRRIRCLLQEHSILHRDLNWRNFLVDKGTGKVTIIDFGDAFVWHGGGVWNRQNYSYRNVVNLFNIWWRSHDEDASLERMIAFTIPEIKGDRQWRPPALATSTLHHWNSLSQHRMGALLLPNQVSGNTNNMVNIQPKEHQQPPDKTLQVPEQWKQVMPGFKGSTTHA